MKRRKLNVIAAMLLLVICSAVALAQAQAAVPIKFEIQYDPGHIDQRHRYTIQARILENGKPQFANTRAYPVITGGNPNTVEVIVAPVR
ncbi:MAG: YbaY family lipoprotein [Pyrinomonadaceae bacterium]